MRRVVWDWARSGRSRHVWLSWGHDVTGVETNQTKIESMNSGTSAIREQAFLLIGDGPERPRLERLTADKSLSNVVFGRSPYSELDRLYSIAYASVET